MTLVNNNKSIDTQNTVNILPSPRGIKRSATIEPELIATTLNGKNAFSPPTARFSERFKRLRSQFTPNQSGEIPVFVKKSQCHFSTALLLSTLDQLEKIQLDTTHKSLPIEAQQPKATTEKSDIKSAREEKNASEVVESSKPKIDHAQENAKANTLNRSEQAALNRANKNPHSQTLFQLEKTLSMLIRAEKIKEGKIEPKEGEPFLGDALALEKNSNDFKFIDRTRTFVGTTIQNQKNDQLRAFQLILKNVEASVKSRRLYYVQDEKMIMEMRGLDPEGYDQEKGVHLSQILDTLLRSEWGKQIVRKHSTEARKAFSLLIDLQIADTRPRQVSAKAFLKNHANTLHGMMEAIIDKQEKVFKDSEGEPNEEALKKLGLSWSDESEKNQLIDILKNHPDSLVIVNENSLLEPHKFLSTWSRRLEASLKVMREAQADPKVIVKHQLEAYSKKIKALEKSLNKESDPKKIELLQKQKTRIEKFHHQLEKAFNQRDLMAQFANVFGVEQADIQASNINGPAVLKKLIRQYLRIKLEEAVEPRQVEQIKGYLKRLEKLTSVDDGRLNYKRLGQLLNKIALMM